MCTLYKYQDNVNATFDVFVILYYIILSPTHNIIVLLYYFVKIKLYSLDISYINDKKKMQTHYVNAYLN